MGNGRGGEETDAGRLQVRHTMSFIRHWFTAFVQYQAHRLEKAVWR